MPLTQSQHTLDDDLRLDFSAGRKLGEVEQALLWSWLQEEPECPSRVLLDKAAHRHIVIAVSLRHVNRWRAARGLNRCPGRPGHADGSQPLPLAQRSSGSRPISRVWACICLPIGSTNRRPLPQWWRSSSRR